MPDRLRISATGAGVSYYPEFLARELGYFADEDLEVVTEAPGHGPWVARALRERTAEVVLGGIWRPLMYRGRLDAFVAFAQLCVRCPTLVIGRRAAPNFRWADLIGRTVVVPDGSPTPNMAFVGILRRKGVDPEKVNIVEDFHADEALSLFRGGLGDFFLAGPPGSDALVAEGKGHVVADLAEAGGRLPWSVYYGLPEFVERKDNLAGRFARAIQRALDWLKGHDPDEAAGVYKRNFPRHKPELIAAAVRATRTRGIWPESVRMAEADLAAWQEMIVEYKLIEKPIPYAEVFDTRAADWVRKNPKP
ncbi:MAG: ABC transporter substrate-binding protein [Proteobacteria bacterium]|nr:ABC transporter substrate-binding protein [Pseudomonadota bacterium]